MNKVPKHLEQYVNYIRNTGRKPLPIAMFDEDWEPIGPQIRGDMSKLGFIYLEGPQSAFWTPGQNEGIRLRPDLEGPDA